ncbi:MAG TPA: hypothetical protein VH186_13445 [Chloroflexia bacterium]|nr:hypothetical protein [Chloroflexia bacterium]
MTGRKKGAAFLLGLAFFLSACGETPRTPTPSYAVPTPPPTPANYDNVPAAATVGSVSRAGGPAPAAPVPAVTQVSSFTTLGPETVPALSDDSSDNNQPDGPSERVLVDIDPTALAKLYGAPGPGYIPGGSLPVSPGPKRSGLPSRAAPTPTLSTNPNAVRIESLTNTPVTFLQAYRQASIKLLEVSRTARLAFASANILKPDRTTWTFFFVATEGPRMWRVIFDSEGNRLDLREVAPSMLADSSIIDITKVLDSSDLLEKAAINGLNLKLPVDIINFQIEGLSKLPCFIFTNVAQGKQVAVNAYTGQVMRNDFGG